MNEVTKTSIFLVVAVVAGLVALKSTPAPIQESPEEIGEKLFPGFTKASAAASLEIVRFDSSEKKTDRLQIANKKGIWSIASHKNYPADAEDAEKRIRDVAGNLMDLKVLLVASEVAGDHEMFGVVDPTSEEVSQNDQGVGMLVGVQDAQGKSLSRLVVGSKVQGAEEQRFVRLPGQDIVYVVKLDAEELSSKFEDWIESDLLSLNKSDIETAVLKDYTFGEEFQLSPQGLVPRFDQRFDVTLSWDSTDSKWELDEFLENRRGRLAPSKLSESEELNSEKLNDFARALDDLKIIDVVSKPKGLGGDLNADDRLIGNKQAVSSLMQRGFYPVSLNGRKEILSSDGEVRIHTKDAVEYILRFGKISGIEEGEDEAKLKRYLLVSARVNEEALTPPEPPAETTKEEAKTDEAEDSETDEIGEAEESAKPQEENTDEAEDSKADEANEVEESAKPQEENTDEVDETENAEETENKEETESKESENNEYQKKLDELKEKREKATESVKQLNDRFADWYYIISEDVYKKIHLGRFDIIQEKKGEGVGVGGFRDLEGGIEEDPANSPGGGPNGLPSGLNGLPPGLGTP